MADVLKLSFGDERQTKSLEWVPTDRLAHSRFNSRTTRSDESVQRLAERMERNGFEVTRALWVHESGEGFEVFAGGTRLEAARAASLESVPVVVHRGYTDDEIVRLADEDNENDEYHVEVPILDRWADCWRLWKEEGWEQKRIAAAKGTDQPTVARRCKWHESLPSIARKAVCDDLLDEGHLIAFDGVVCDVTYLQPWLTTAQAQAELVREVLSKHRGKSEKIKPSVKNVREAAKRWKAMIRAAEEEHAKLTAEHESARSGSAEAAKNWAAEFVGELQELCARTLSQVTKASSKVRTRIQEEAERIRREAEGGVDRAREEAERLNKIDAFVGRLAHGDALFLAESCPEGATVVATDPPYGVDYQSSRRTTSSKKKKIDNDADPKAAADLTREVLTKLYGRLAEDATAFVFTGWRHEQLFRDAVEGAGFRIKGSLVWVKNNHGTGDLRGSFAPKHERVIHAVKGNPSLRKRSPDVLSAKDKQNSDHPTEKPVGLLRQLIEASSDEGDLVLDPFAGSGSTLLAADESGRDFWGCELDDDWFKKLSTLLHEMATGRFGQGSEDV